MNKSITQTIEIPAGISCEVVGQKIVCKKDSHTLSRTVDNTAFVVAVKGNTLTLNSKKGSKRERKLIHSILAHVKNMFLGLDKQFVYNLEACNVHFPMTLKVDGDNLMINNFLGEKTPRSAKIVQGATVEIKGAKITVSSPDREVAGQTAANIEKATRVRNRDRRVFQDGIYITQKPGREL